MFDVIVIGAGINGSSAAYELTKQKKNVLLLEQFPLPHTRGSSHGQTRIIRCLYPQKIYAKMTHDSFPIWKDLEKKVNETLLIQNGMLEVYKNTNVADLKAAKEVLTSLNVPFETLGFDEVNQRYKPLHFNEGYSALYEPDGGTLMASKCLAAFQELFRQNDGVLHDNEQVIKILPGKHCTVVTNKQTYTAKSIVITAGAFTSRLLNPLQLNLPLTVKRTCLCFWRLANPAEGTPEAGFPSFIGPHHCYGLASIEYPGLLKICYHGGVDVEIDYPDRPPFLENQKKFINQHMVGVENEPAITEGCLYTCTPDDDFILDSHPKYSNIIIGAGFSGTGFKMSPVTGKILASLALGLDPGYDISTFRINRFGNVMKINSAL